MGPGVESSSVLADALHPSEDPVWAGEYVALGPRPPLGLAGAERLCVAGFA